MLLHDDFRESFPGAMGHGFPGAVHGANHVLE